MTTIVTDHVVKKAGPKTVPPRAKEPGDRPGPVVRADLKVVEQIETAVYSTVICCALETDPD